MKVLDICRPDNSKLGAHPEEAHLLALCGAVCRALNPFAPCYGWRLLVAEPHAIRSASLLSHCWLQGHCSAVLPPLMTGNKLAAEHKLAANMGFFQRVLAPRRKAVCVFLQATPPTRCAP